MVYDGLMLVNSIFNNRDGAFALSMIPYTSLFCKSTQEFFDLEPSGHEITNKVIDIRNGLKAFTGRYGRSKKFTHNLDYNQNLQFKEKLRFKVLKFFNLHYNAIKYAVSTAESLYQSVHF